MSLNSQCGNQAMTQTQCYINSFLIMCRLLITFANSLYPDQARQNAGPDLDPNHNTLMVILKEHFLKS